MTRSPTADEGVQSAKGPLVLCVEDNPQNLLLVEKVLGDAGFRVLAASDGPMAVERACLERPAVVLLDLHLPGFDGFETLRRIRELPGLQKTRVLALTADVVRESRDDVLARGFDDYLAKPFLIRELVERVRALLARHDVSPG